MEHVQGVAEERKHGLPLLPVDPAMKCHMFALMVGDRKGGRPTGWCAHGGLVVVMKANEQVQAMDQGVMEANGHNVAEPWIGSGSGHAVAAGEESVCHKDTVNTDTHVPISAHVPGLSTRGANGSSVQSADIDIPTAVEHHGSRPHPRPAVRRAMRSGPH